MKKQLLLSILITAFCVSITDCITAQTFRSIPSLEDYYSLGYSVGPGQGGTLAIDKIISDSDKGALGIGGLINIRNKSLNQGDESYFIAAGKLSYHPYLVDVPRLDLYGHFALGVGYETVKNNNRYTGPREEYERTATVWGLAVGARFRVIGRIGIFAEVGYGIGYATTGLTLNI